MLRTAVAGFAVIGFASLPPVWPVALGHEPTLPGASVETSIGPEVREAFDRAMARYPESIREALAHVELRRERSYGVPADAPLMARLMGDAVYAYYSMNGDAITLLDAGRNERARWTGGDANEREVAGLMLALGLMDGDGDPVTAWARFVEIVQSWPGEGPIEGDIRFGDERVLDRFVRLGVGRALARDWEDFGSLDLEQQMVHELAHALQLSGRGMEAAARMQAWGSLSGWQRSDTGEAFDGFHGGMVMLEDPAVLGRLLVSDQRGEGLYEHAPGARFVNRYARYDAREDYAECVRLFIEDPERLIRTDPTKFLFINALGYNAALSLAEPGPLWISAQQIEERGWGDLVQQGARELLEGREGVRADPRTVAALLRAHAPVLRGDTLPEREVYREAPADAPDAIRRALNPEHFSVEIDGKRYGPDAAGVRRLLDDAIIDWREDDGFWRAMDALMEPTAESVEEEFASLADLDDPQARAMASARLFAKLGVIDAPCAGAMMAREVRAMRASGCHLLAELLKLRYALGTGSSVSADLVDQWASAAVTEGTRYGAIELGRGLVDLLLREGEVDRAMRVARSIRGDAWGAIRRAEALGAIAQATGDVSLLDTIDGPVQPELNGYIQRMIEDAREAIAGAEEREE